MLINYDVATAKEINVEPRVAHENRQTITELRIALRNSAAHGGKHLASVNLHQTVEQILMLDAH